MSEKIVNRVLRRYIASLNVQAYDNRYVPPLSIVNAVETGALPEEVLNSWKYCAETLGERFEYNACIKYWRSKCAKMNITLPKEYVEGLGGKGAQGRWTAKTGDDVEVWVKETIKSQGVLDDLGRSVLDWKQWVGHYESEVGKAQMLVEKHLKGLGEAKSDKGLQQRTKWLEGARKDLQEQSAELEKARKAMTALEEAANKYPETKSPTIEFEKEFQFMVLLALKEFDKTDVLKAVQTAIERVDQGIQIPGAIAPEEGTIGYKQAGLFDTLGKAWDYLSDKFHTFVDWVSGIMGLTKKIDKMMSDAGAK